jgi:hypothetical protein
MDLLRAQTSLLKIQKFAHHYLVYNFENMVPKNTYMRVILILSRVGVCSVKSYE